MRRRLTPWRLSVFSPHLLSIPLQNGHRAPWTRSWPGHHSPAGVSGAEEGKVSRADREATETRDQESGEGGGGWPLRGRGSRKACEAGDIDRGSYRGRPRRQS